MLKSPLFLIVTSHNTKCIFFNHWESSRGNPLCHIARKMFQEFKRPCVMTRTVFEQVPFTICSVNTALMLCCIQAHSCSLFWFIYKGTDTQITKIISVLFLKAWRLPRFPLHNCSAYTPCCPFFKEVYHGIMTLLPKASILEEKLGTHHPALSTAGNLETEERVPRGSSIDSHSAFLPIHSCFFLTKNAKLLLSWDSNSPSRWHANVLSARGRKFIRNPCPL